MRVQVPGAVLPIERPRRRRIAKYLPASLVGVPPQRTRDQRLLGNNITRRQARVASRRRTRCRGGGPTDRSGEEPSGRGAEDPQRRVIRRGGIDTQPSHNPSLIVDGDRIAPVGVAGIQEENPAGGGPGRGLRYAILSDGGIGPVDVDRGSPTRPRAGGKQCESLAVAPP